MPRPIQIIITTAPRVGTPSPYSYYYATMAALMDQVVECPLGWDLTVHVSDDKQRSGHIGGLRLALEKATPGYDVLLLQDDLKICKNGVRAMCCASVADDHGFISFCDGYHFPSPTDARGLLSIPMVHHLFGLQAVKLPAATVSILKDAFTKPKPTHDSSDIFVSQSLLDHFPLYAICMPNLVQHVGEISSVIDPRDGKPYNNREKLPTVFSVNYPGDNFDALTLGAL